jgi:hypothetical protein
MRQSRWLSAALVLAVQMVAALHAQDSSQAVIIQAWMPSEADGLGWGSSDRDELWNDCFL